MRPRRLVPFLMLLAAVALVATSAHAAPVPEGQLPKKMHRELRSKPLLSPYTPGKPMHFPRELLPLLLGELDADIQEPGDDDNSSTLFSRGRAAPRPEPLEVGPNHLLNDPSGDNAGATQSENALAALGRFLVAGWNDSFDPGAPRSFSGFGYSSDGGRTWTDGGILPHAPGGGDATFGDPDLAVDRDGNFYYASLYSPDLAHLGVSVSRGRFQGSSFSFGPPVLAGVPDPGDLDKEWIAVDPDDGTLYVSYTRFFDEGGQQIELVHSTDHGRTWSAPAVVSDRAVESTQGSRPIVGEGHQVFVIYSVVDLTDFQAHMRIRRTTNGRTFGPRVNVGESPGDIGVFTNTVSGPPGFNRSNGVEFPSIAIDRSRGRGHGTLYVTWPEAVDFFDDPLATGATVPEVEGNNGPTTATPFTPGDLLTGSYSSGSDQDWFSFTGTAGQTVNFFLTPPDGGGGDGFLRLFCRNGAVSDRLALSYFGNGLAFICFTLPSSGTYYLRALPATTTSRTGPYLIGTGLHVPTRRDVASDSRDVMISSSRDGKHWTRRTRVNDDAPRYDNAFPEVAVDGDGDVHVVWYDHREDATFGVNTDVFQSRSRDGGGHFSANTRVNDGPATNWNVVPSRLAPNIGDYISLVSDGNSVYASWADGRLGSPDSWMAAVSGGDEDERGDGRDDRALAARSDPDAALSTLRLTVQNPARANAPLELNLSLPASGEATVELYSVTGQHVRTLFSGPATAGTRRLTWDARARGGESLPAGLYFAKLRFAGREAEQRIVLLP